MATKITLLSFLLILSLPMFANIPVPFWNEDFSAGGLPAGWEIEDTNDNQVLWSHCTNFNECPPITFHQSGLLPDRRFESFSMENGFAYLSPFNNGSSTDLHESSLTSQNIDCSSKTQVFLVFNTFIIAANSSPMNDAIVEVRQGAIGNWTEFQVFQYLDQSIVETDSDERLRSYNGQFICLDISSVAAGNEDIQIRWKWNWAGDEEYFWLLDDINLLEVNPFNERAVWGADPTEGNFLGGLNDWSTSQSGDCVWEWSESGLVDYPDSNDKADAYSCSCSIADGMMLLNPTCSQSNTFSELISPTVNLSSYNGGKKLGLKFSQSGAVGNSASNNLPLNSIVISLDGGISFIDTFYLNLNEPFSKPFCNSKTIVLPDEVLSAEEFQFRFVFAGNTFFWSIDDVRIIELYDYDLKISSDYFSVPPNIVMPTMVVEPIAFGAEIQNVGNLAQNDIQVIVSVNDDESHATVFADTLFISSLAPGEVYSEAYFDDKFLPEPIEKNYTTYYQVKSNFTDEEPFDNKTSYRFKVGSDVISKQLDPTSINAGFSPIGNNIRYEIGNCFFIPPGSSAITYAMRFATANAAQIAPSSIALKANLYKWKTPDSFADANGDLLANEDEYEIVTFGYYILEDENLRLRDVIEVPFNDEVILEDSTYYFTTIEYFAPAIWPNNQEIPFFISASEETNFAAMSDQADLEGMPRFVSMMKISTDDFFQVNPWGLLRIPFVQLVIDETTNTVENLEETWEVTIYPNPTNDFLFIELTPVDKVVNVEIYDICGRLVDKRHFENAFVSQLPINVSNLSEGIYTLRVNSGNRFFAQNFVKSN